MLDSVCLLGANHLLGQHLVTQLAGKVQVLNLWTYKDKFVNKVESNDNVEPNGIYRYVGMDGLESAIRNCRVVINMHEHQDLSFRPDAKDMEEQNVEFVKKLVTLCEECQTSLLVHMSSVYVQCSGRWPNLGNKELEPALFLSDTPYPAYSKTKVIAEDLVLQDRAGMKSLVARVGPLYGEGDECSVVCDLIRVRDRLGLVPALGDFDGCLQMTYAGNAAAAIVESAELMMIRRKLKREVVNIVDETPSKPLLKGVCMQLIEKQSKPVVTRWAIPFFILYPLFAFLFFVGLIFNSRLGQLPSFGHFYMLFRQWTSLSNYRLRLLFDHKPKFDPDESVQRCRAYYAKIRGQDLHDWSWKVVPS